MTVYTFSSGRTLKGGGYGAALEPNEARRQPGEKKNFSQIYNFISHATLKPGGLESRLFVQMFKEP